MAQRELDILAEARTTLNDGNQTNYRWSDERLIKLLEDAQEDMCKHIPMIVHKTTIYPNAGTLIYELPKDSVRLLSAVGTRPLTITSEEMLSESRYNWEDDRGCNPTHIVVNELSQGEVRPYPAIAVDCSIGAIKLRYQALPPRLGWDGRDTVDTLRVATMWDLGLTQYIIARAFLDYGDESSVGRSQLAMGIYKQEFDRASRLAKKSFSKRVIVTPFQSVKKTSTHQGGQYGGSCRHRY